MFLDARLGGRVAQCYKFIVRRHGREGQGCDHREGKVLMLVDIDALETEADDIQPAAEPSSDDLLRLFKATARKRNSTAEEFIDLAGAFMRLDMRAEAYAAYSEAIARASDSRNAFVGRGELFFGDALLCEDPELLARNAGEALADYRTALTLGPDRTASLGVGSCLLLLNRLLEADCWFQELVVQSELAKDRNYRIDVLFLQAIGRVLSGNREKAQIITGSIERFAGDECESLFILSLGALLDGQFEEFEKFQSRLRHKDPKLARALETLGTQGCGGFADVARALS